MKPHPDFTSAADIIREMTQAAHSSSDDANFDGPHRVDGPPETPEEQEEAREDLARIIDAGGVRFLCVGCGESMSVDEHVGFCECGGFVCAACQRVEEEGVCNHEASPFQSDADD